MSRLKNLYTYLITNRRAEVDGWLDDYISFSSDVTKVSTALVKALQPGPDGMSAQIWEDFLKFSYGLCNRAERIAASATREMIEKDSGINPVPIGNMGAEFMFFHTHENRFSCIFGG
jgi:hypothetical protein